MSREIDSVVIGGLEDRRLVLSNAQVAREISIGNSWNVIRLGVRLSFDDLGTGISGTPRLWLGMLANPVPGLTNGPLSTSTSPFVGIWTDYPTWQRVSGPSGYSTLNSSAVKKVGASVTQGDPFNLFGCLSLAPATYRTAVILEITKGSPNFSIQTVYNSGNAVFDTSSSALVSAMGSGTMAGAASSLANAYYVSSPVYTIAVDESESALNAICLAWDRVTPKIRVSDFYWSLIS